MDSVSVVAGQNPYLMPNEEYKDN
jgi:centrosomal protein CEP41